MEVVILVITVLLTITVIAFAIQRMNWADKALKEGDKLEAIYHMLWVLFYALILL